MKKRMLFLLMAAITFGMLQAQKGALSLAAGPLLSVPLSSDGLPSLLTTGGGLEAIGQYNVTNRSAAVVQSSLAFYGSKDPYSDYDEGVAIFSFRGGYQYQFADSHFFINGLGGIDRYSGDGLSSISFALGAGKRFRVTERSFIDAGVDLVFGDADMRLNVKALVSLFRNSN